MLPDPDLHDAFWTYDDPDLGLCITFDADMNTAIKPPPSNFTLIVDDVNKTPDSLTWLNDRVLGFDFSEAALGPSVVNLSFPTPHPLLRFATGAQVGSFFADGAEQTPEASGEFIDPDYTVDVSFDTNMDQTITPLITDFSLIANGSPVDIDGVNWFSATQLIITGSLDEGGEANVILNFPMPTPRLRATDTHQMCPFSIDVGFG